LTVRSRLAQHLEGAKADFASRGFTNNQLTRIGTNPELEAAFRGERIDTFFKQRVLNGTWLDSQGIQVTPRFKFGPGVYDPVNKVWYDVTTPGQWPLHVDKYTPGFGQGVPLHY
jgi:hypothetical protein